MTRSLIKIVAPYHHNNVAGRDEWRDVRALIVVGRTLPAPGAVSRIAEALTGSAVDLLEPWYERADATRTMADGTTIAAEAEHHPDPLTEAIRWQTCEGEIVQIIGRARAVNRSQADPVDVLVLTDVPLPLPLDGTLGAAELTPSPDDLMLAEGGVAFENATDAASAYPILWGNREAAKKALERGRLGTSPYYNFYRGLSPTSVCVGGTLVRVAYQMAGSGAKECMALVDPFEVPDPARALRKMLGTVLWVRRVNSDDPPPPDRPPRGKRKPTPGIEDRPDAPLGDKPEDPGPEPPDAPGAGDLTDVSYLFPETSRRHEALPPWPLNVAPGPARLAAWWRAAQAQSEARAPLALVQPPARAGPEAMAP